MYFILFSGIGRLFLLPFNRARISVFSCFMQVNCSNNGSLFLLLGQPEKQNTLAVRSIHRRVSRNTHPVCLSIDLIVNSTSDIAFAVFVKLGAHSNHILPPAIFN